MFGLRTGKKKNTCSGQDVNFNGMLKAGSGREESALTGKPPKRGALLYCARVLAEIGSEALQRRMKSEELG